jgi:hypothetical protein
MEGYKIKEEEILDRRKRGPMFFFSSMVRRPGKIKKRMKN